MRIAHVLAFAAVATLSVSAFAEGNGTSVPHQAANNVLINAHAQSAARLAPGEAQHMVGSFQLEDGRLMVLTSKRNTLFADFDGKREELVPVGGNRFVSRDTGAQLTFNQVPFASEVVLDQVKR